MTLTLRELFKLSEEIQNELVLHFQDSLKTDIDESPYEIVESLTTNLPLSRVVQKRTMDLAKLLDAAGALMAGLDDLSCENIGEKK